MLTGLDFSSTAVAMTSDGRCLGTGGDNGDVLVHDIADRSHVFRLCGHQSRITALCFSPSGNHIASGSSDVRVWDATRDADWVEPPMTDEEIREEIRASGAGAAMYVNTGGIGGQLRVLHTRAKSVTCLAWSDDGRMLVAGGDDGVVYAWDPHDGRELATLRGHDGLVTCVAVSGDGQFSSRQR